MKSSFIIGGVLTAAILLVACSGTGSSDAQGGSRLTHDEYQARMEEIDDEGWARFEPIGCVITAGVPSVRIDDWNRALNRLWHHYRWVYEQYSAIEPPADIDDVHRDYVTGLERRADEYEALLTDVEAGAVLPGEAMGRLADLSVKYPTRIEDFASRGYDVFAVRRFSCDT